MPIYYLATETLHHDFINNSAIHCNSPFGGFLGLTTLNGPSVLLLLRLEKFLIRKATLFSLIFVDLPTTADKLWIDIF